MTYIENVFLCMVSPLLIAALCMGKRQTRFFFFCFAAVPLIVKWWQKRLIAYRQERMFWC